MRAKKRMSLEEHEAVARRLHRAMAELEAVGKILLPAYGASTRLGALGVRLFATAGRTTAFDVLTLLDRAWDAEGHGREGGRRNPYCGDYANSLRRDVRDEKDAA